jgi:hypothetical protein
MGFDIRSVKVGDPLSGNSSEYALEGIDSREAVYNNPEKMIYALDRSYHGNAGWKLVPVYEISKEIMALANNVFPLKDVNTIFLDQDKGEFIDVRVETKVNNIHIDMATISKLAPTLESIVIDSEVTHFIWYY